jgi:hypothetical protein
MTFVIPYTLEIRKGRVVILCGQLEAELKVGCGTRRMIALLYHWDRWRLARRLCETPAVLV